MKKFDKFINEKNDDIDPYGEEDWTGEEDKKKELINRCIDVVNNQLWDFRDMINHLLKREFERYSIDDLEEFIGYDEIDCEPCEGTGLLDNGEVCQVCGGSGVVRQVY